MRTLHGSTGGMRHEKGNCSHNFIFYIFFRTSYDAERKQHWLSVHRSNLGMQFLLKDHGESMKKGVIHDSATMDRQIHEAVDQMIATITQRDAVVGANNDSSSEQP